MSTDPDAQPAVLPDGAAQVLTAVRVHGCRTRVEVGRQTGMTRMVTAQRVQQLIELGLLREEGLGASSGGRRPRRLIFDPPGHLLVADVGWTSIDVAVTDLTGRLLVHRAEDADVTVGPEPILERLEHLFDQVIAEAADLGPLWGIGIGIPAPVEFGTGRAVAPAGMAGWDGYPVRDRLAERFGAPTWVDNDVNIMLLGECLTGAAQGHRDVVFVKLGTGMGIGMISDGHLHRGAQGSAGRLGNLLTMATSAGDFGLPPPGESASSWTAGVIAAEAERLARTGASDWLRDAIAGGRPASPRLVAEAAMHGDSASFDLLRRAGLLIGTMLAGVVSLYNPSIVVLGGGMSESGDFFLAAIRQAVHGHAVPLATRDLRIVKADLGSTAGVVGAAAMVLDELLSPRNLNATVGRWLGRAG